MKYSTLLFDFDGTISDSFEGISKSAQHALAQLGITVADRNDLRRFIGPTLAYAFSEFYHLSEEDTAKAIELYRMEYRKSGIFQLTLYDGIEALIKKLYQAGFTLCIASAKPRVFLEQILEHLHLTEYFTIISGCEFDGTRGNKDEIIEYTLSKLDDVSRDSVLMIGDRFHDAEGAAANQIDFCGVLFGFGSKKELEAYHPVYLADTASDLEHFLFSEQVE